MISLNTTIAIWAVLPAAILSSIIACSSMPAKQTSASATTSQTSQTQIVKSAFQPVMVQKPTQQPEPETQKDFVHTVQYTGETLSDIAQWYTGKRMNWPKLAGANPELNPDLIRIGDKIRIPIDLLMTAHPMPATALLKKPLRHQQPDRRADANKPSDSVEQTPSSETKELFGPIEPASHPEEQELFKPIYE